MGSDLGEFVSEPPYRACADVTYLQTHRSHFTRSFCISPLPPYRACADVTYLQTHRSHLTELFCEPPSHLSAHAWLLTTSFCEPPSHHAANALSSLIHIPIGVISSDRFGTTPSHLTAHAWTVTTQPKPTHTWHVCKIWISMKTRSV